MYLDPIPDSNSCYVSGVVDLQTAFIHRSIGGRADLEAELRVGDCADHARVNALRVAACPHDRKGKQQTYSAEYPSCCRDLHGEGTNVPDSTWPTSFPSKVTTEIGCSSPGTMSPFGPLTIAGGGPKSLAELAYPTIAPFGPATGIMAGISAGFSVPSAFRQAGSGGGPSSSAIAALAPSMPKRKASIAIARFMSDTNFPFT